MTTTKIQKGYKLKGSYDSYHGKRERRYAS